MQSNLDESIYLQNNYSEFKFLKWNSNLNELASSHRALYEKNLLGFLNQSVSAGHFSKEFLLKISQTEGLLALICKKPEFRKIVINSTHYFFDFSKNSQLANSIEEFRKEVSNVQVQSSKEPIKIGKAELRFLSSNVNTQEEVQYTPSEQIALADRFYEAFQIFEIICPNAAATFNLFVDEIEICRNNNRPESGFNSSSSGWLGRIRTENPHLKANTTAQMIDFFVHETIHQVVFAIEENYPIIKAKYRNENVVHEKSLPSPWSGVLIDTHSYIHANFVWFGIFNFWYDVIYFSLNDENKLVADLKDAKKCLIAAARGFLNCENIESRLGLKIHMLEPWVCKILNSNQLEIKEKLLHIKTWN